jgi:hypothetical protein
LCTVAWCDPIPGNDKQVSCHCTVNIGYSAGQEPCSAAPFRCENVRRL